MGQVFGVSTAKAVKEAEKQEKQNTNTADSKRVLELFRNEVMAVRGVDINPPASLVQGFIDTYGVEEAERIIKWFFTEKYRGEFPRYKQEPMVITTEFMQAKFRWLADRAQQEWHQAHTKKQDNQKRRHLTSLLDLVR